MRKSVIESAMNLLVADSTQEIIDMVNKIAKQKDKSVLIDHIDGVQVWEPLEFSMTASNFLKTINYV